MLAEQFQYLPDFVYPDASGTVVLEWEGAGGRANFEVGRTSFSFYTAPNIGESIFLDGEIDGLNVNDLNYAIATIKGANTPPAATTSNLIVGTLV